MQKQKFTMVVAAAAALLFGTAAMAAQQSTRAQGVVAVHNAADMARVKSMFGPESPQAIIRVDESSFLAGSGLITFSEFPQGTNNPVYAPGDYGGGASNPTVSFGGFFAGQHLGTAAECPPGAALSGCVVGAATAPLTLDPASPATSIVGDGANPTSPVLSGSPTFNGPIAILFDSDQAGVGLDGGYFDAAGGTAITAFARDGSVIGSVSNDGTGIEFLGLVTADGSNQIAGLLFSLVGDEPAGFAIDNVRFGVRGQVGPGGGATLEYVPVPTLDAAGLLLLLMGMVGLAFLVIRR